MTKAYRDVLTASETEAPGTISPGKRTLTSNLLSRGAIVRAAIDALRDPNGVSPGAGAASDPAAATSGAPRSDQAHARNGALLADLGHDVQLGAGELQPDDPFGMHLLAHEVPRRQQHAPVRRKGEEGAVSDQKVMRSALDRASHSSAQGLPDELRARFEKSTGADLGHVRIHTGADSHTAAAAVGAKAYAVGDDIHFAEGQYQPESATGQELIAHEVFHTLQAPGAGGGGDDVVELSESGDAAEVEADRGAAAMVRGEQATRPTAASPGIVRRKPNSYSEQKGLTWSNGTALTDDEMADWGVKKQLLFTQGLSYVGLAAGFKPSLGAEELIAKLEKEAMAEHKSRAQMLRYSIAHLESELKGADGKRTTGSLWWKKQNEGWEAYYQKVKRELASERSLLEKHEDGKEDNLARATKQANGALAAINSFVSKANSTAKAINNETSTLNPAVFEDMGKATAAIDKMTKAIDFGTKLLDRTTFDAFEKNPCEATAIAWARHAGSVFKSAGSFASGLPGGWGTVISNMCAMPAIVTENFYGAMTRRYQKIDAEVKDGNGSKVLDEGTTG